MTHASVAFSHPLFEALPDKLETSDFQYTFVMTFVYLSQKIRKIIQEFEVSALMG